MRHRLVTASALITIAAVVGAVAPARSAAAPLSPSRQSRTSGIAIAGSNVYVWSTHRGPADGGGCTLSFIVQSRSTDQPGALTAGHCVGTLPGGPTYSVHQTRNLSGDTTDPGVELGTVSSGGYVFGRGGDSAFMGLSDGRAARPAVYVGGPRSHRTVPVVGIARPHPGLHVCYSGAVTGEHCGFRVVGHPSTISFPDRHHTYRISHEWRATRHTCTSRDGDSGSPVYDKRHGRAYAVGILSGGQKHAGRCPFFFTPVRVALATLDLRLVTVS